MKAGMMDPEKSVRIFQEVQRIVDEYVRARELYRPYTGAHDGYAKILEELDEAWDEIKADNLPLARKEMVQVGATVLAFLCEVDEDTQKNGRVKEGDNA